MPRLAAPGMRAQTGPMAFTMKRVYDDAAAGDGFRVLVDRLWPRGVSTERAELDLWDKDVAPSPQLRTAWHHQLEDFDRFADDYRSELDRNPAAEALVALGRKHDRVTLLYGARDEQTNHVTVLLDWLAAHGADVER